MPAYKKQDLRKIAIPLIALLGLTAVLTISTLVANSSKKQDIRSKAAEMESVTNASVATAGNGVADNLIMPGVQGFQSSDFTGDTALTYGFDLPKGPGGFTPSVGLAYSSAFVADYFRGAQERHVTTHDFAQAGLAGFGWDITGIGSITKNYGIFILPPGSTSGYYEETFNLSLGGASYTLIPDPGNNIPTASAWKTSPDSKMKIYHTLCNGSSGASGTGYWSVTDTSGTWYMFGGQSGDDCSFVTAGNQHWATAVRLMNNRKNDTSYLEAYKWMLRMANDVHGNSIVYNYKQQWKNVHACSGDNAYHTDLTQASGAAPITGFYSNTTAVLPDTIVYGKGGHAVTVQFNYETRSDPYAEGWKDCSSSGKYNAATFSTARIDNVTISQNGKTYSSYELGYKDSASHFTNAMYDVDYYPNGASFPPDGTRFENTHHGHSLLTSVTRAGKDGGKLPAYTFSYNDGAGVDANNVLLMTADNGYGGKVSYNYAPQSFQLCALNNGGVTSMSGFPTYDPCESKTRNAVTSRVVSDSATGKTYTVSYTYTGGLGKYEQDPSIDGSTNHWSHTVNFQFLGYGQVIQTTTKNNSSDPAKITRTSYHQAYGYSSVGDHTCFNPDSRLGKPYSVETLDSDKTTVLAKSETTYQYSNPACTIDRVALHTVAFGQILPKTTKNTIKDSASPLTSETDYSYDKYGNVTLSTNKGFNNVDSPRYTVTYYNANTDRNILNKPYMSVVSDRADGKLAYSVTKTYFDGAATLLATPAVGNATRVISGGFSPIPGGRIIGQNDADSLLSAQGAQLVTSAEGDMLLDFPSEDVLGISDQNLSEQNTVNLLTGASPTPTPYFTVRSVDPQGTPVPVQKLSKANCSAAPCTVSATQSNTASAIYAYGGANLVGGALNDSYYEVIGVTPDPVAGTPYPTCRGMTDGTSCYVWPSWNSGSRTITFVVATPTITPTTTITPTPLPATPTPYLQIQTVNTSGQPIAVQNMYNVACATPPCRIITGMPNASSMTVKGGQNLTGGRVQDRNLVVVGITPRPVSGTSYPSCRGTSNGTGCYVWPAWNTDARTVIFVMATPTNTPTPTATLTPSPTAPQAVTKYAYDNGNKGSNVISTTDARGHITATTYIDSLLPNKITNPLSWITTTEYDPVLSKPNLITDQNLAASQIRYDEFGRIKKTWGPGNTTGPVPLSDPPMIIATYSDTTPMVVKVDTLVDKNSNTYTSSCSFYNGLGQKIEEKKQWDKDSGGHIRYNVTYISYTSLGQTEYTVLPFLSTEPCESFIKNSGLTAPATTNRTKNFFDMLGRTTKVSNPDGTVIQTDYSGNKTTVYDANDPGKNGHNRKVTTVNGFGETVQIDEYKDGAIYMTQKFYYDAAGRLYKSVDPGNHESTFVYNVLGRKIQESNPDNGTTKYSYDNAGNLVAKTDNKGQTISMTYDAINRIVKRTYPDSTSVDFKYDGRSLSEDGQPTPTIIPFQKGKLTVVSNPSATNQNLYDIKGQLISESKTIDGDPTTYTTSYTYDDANRLVKIKYPDGEVVTQSYTDSSLPDTLTGKDPYITDSTYNIQGQLTRRKFGNGTTLTQNYYDQSATTQINSFRLKDIILDSPVAQGPGAVAGAQSERPAIHQPYYYPTPDPGIFGSIISVFKK